MNKIGNIINIFVYIFLNLIILKTSILLLIHFQLIVIYLILMIIENKIIDLLHIIWISTSFAENKFINIILRNVNEQIFKYITIIILILIFKL